MSLKVFDLECQHGHVFEGWFSSHDDYDSQHARGLLSCPMCGNGTISKKLSAPRLNVSHLHRSQDGRAPQPDRPASAQAPASASRGPSPSAGASTPGQPSREDRARVQAAMLQQVREMVRHAENVGPRFAEEARRMHEGDAAERAIRGTATPEERAELAEEGIAVMGVPDFFDTDRLQ